MRGRQGTRRTSRAVALSSRVPNARQEEGAAHVARWFLCRRRGNARGENEARCRSRAGSRVDTDEECAAGTGRGARRSLGSPSSNGEEGAAITGRGVHRTLDFASSEILCARQARGAARFERGALRRRRCETRARNGARRTSRAGQLPPGTLTGRQGREAAHVARWKKRRRQRRARGKGGRGARRAADICASAEGAEPSARGGQAAARAPGEGGGPRAGRRVRAIFRTNAPE